MLRAIRVLAPAERHGRPVIDTVILDYAHAARAGEGSPASKAAPSRSRSTTRRLATDDLLVFDDGGLVEVVAAAEPLIEARGSRRRRAVAARLAARRSPCARAGAAQPHSRAQRGRRSRRCSRRSAPRTRCSRRRSSRKAAPTLHRMGTVTRIADHAHDHHHTTVTDCGSPACRMDSRASDRRDVQPGRAFMRSSQAPIAG